MYGKIFETVFTGSLYGSGPTVFAVWAYVIATAKPPGVCELNPKLLAGTFGCDVQQVRDAIQVLCEPDDDSRNNEEEGRRLIHLEAFQYRVVSFDKYRLMVSMDEKREADRRRIATKRDATRQPATKRDSRQTSLGVADVAHTEVEVEVEERRNTNKPKGGGSDAGLPEWLPVDAWVAFVDHRRAIRKPMTPAAVPINLRTLGKLREAGNDPRAVIDQSIENGWTGLFPIRADGRASPATSSREDGRRAAAAAIFDNLPDLSLPDRGVVSEQ